VSDVLTVSGGSVSGQMEQVDGRGSPTDLGETRLRSMRQGWASEDRPLDGALLAEMLARASSGLGFIYATLDELARAHRLHDVALVVDSSGTGCQVFRRGRRELSGAVSRLPTTTQLLTSPGLHAEPSVIPDDLSAMVVHLCTVALRLDLLAHDASHDSLTGLYNRRTYEQSLEQAVSRTQRYGWPFGLILLDIDDFKAVNDRHGHAAGDSVLRAVGGGLRASLRGGDVGPPRGGAGVCHRVRLAARMGGDEFALLVLNADTRAVLEPVTQRLRKALDRVVPDADIHFSTGVAFFPDDAEDGDGLMRLADLRLYEHKSRAAVQAGDGPQDGSASG
jgi:diguanylate cyclase (GGDEF)-like protein